MFDVCARAHLDWLFRSRAQEKDDLDHPRVMVTEGSQKRTVEYQPINQVTSVGLQKPEYKVHATLITQSADH